MSSWRRGTAGAVAAMLASAIAGLAPGPADAEPATSPAMARPAAVRAYWTEARMRAAEPADLRKLPSGRIVRAAPAARGTAADASSDNTGYPRRVHGKVFFTIEGGSDPGDFVCSATAVASNSHALVWTAGHCVDDAEFGGGFAKKWEFVPGYRSGERPFGSWPAKRLLTTRGWKRDANVRVDIGAAVVTRDGQGRGLQDVVGARGIAFDIARSQAYTAFGYPALPTLLHPEFNGERLYTCDSGLSGGDNPPGAGPAPLEIECDMTGGSSGGGWVIDDGRVASVTSYGYAGDLFHLYGPYQGQAARDLFTEAAGPPISCAGAPVTNLGGRVADSFTGADGNEVLKMRGGADRAAGGAGDDRACGGAGGDRLVGADGDDVLRGSRGRDELTGGPGHDVCVGGPGRDRARSCEERRRIP